MSRLVCGEGVDFSLDSYETQLSNNVCCIGSTGSGKSRSFVSSNIEQLYGSSLIYDPKGSLYKKYAAWLRERGYHVGKLDFSNTKDSLHYNPFAYIHTTQDVSKVAYALIHEEKNSKVDPFWEESSRMLVQSLISYLLASRPASAHNMGSVMYLLEMCCQSGDLDENSTPLDKLFAGMRNRDSEMGQYAQRCYRQFRVACNRTLRNILVSTCARLVPFTSREMEELTSYDNVNITMLGQRKTALFVVCSDSEGGHLDRLVRLFFTQGLQELCRFADTVYEDQRLPVPIRLILDDFACGVSLSDFNKSIAIIRSRNISAMIILQSISQLTDLYSPSAAKTIINNCDTIVFMGCNDVDTAQEIALRTNLPMRKILYQPLGQSWVFRRGQEPRLVKNISPETLLVHEVVHGAKHTQKVTEMYISA